MKEKLKTIMEIKVEDVGEDKLKLRERRRVFR